MNTAPSSRPAFARPLAAAALLLGAAAAQAAPTSVLFVGNSFTFGRADPVMSYNHQNVRDLTEGMLATNATGSNVYEPRPWGGVPGIFQRLTFQAGLDYDVAMTTRNAATLRGHMLNTNPANWDLRSNLASQTWSQVVLQEQSDEALTRRPGLNSNPARFNNYVDKISEYVQNGTVATYRERDYYAGATNTEKTNNCVAVSGASSTACNAQRGTDAGLSDTFRLPVNPNASASTDVYLYQTWARPDLVTGAFVSTTDDVTGVVTRTATPKTTFFPDLESMTEELRLAYAGAATLAGDITGIAPVGEAFMRAVKDGLATRDFYAADALTDGKIDLWFDDGFHPSKYGSYLSALTLFGTLTGENPAQFGYGELAAAELGISAEDSWALQRVAALQLGFAPALPVPEPSTALLSLAGLAAVLGGRRWRGARR
ncbi:PEP-CTERM sorting domain-containing protein [Aquabacterium sp. J223]|uniref:PEP-CTERM sorting domain-containing protein n=1 Tax=Aquabacterium sp. J223 TaxID=2898431 RepID=UPI0021AD8486|nr:PEP-CTERM sorting domain-containing protein [Aquabacterium sp. J223]UUX95949.1 PEP-CTERM sorting domain-containing protein [Aquabacterium sp. J223]